MFRILQICLFVSFLLVSAMAQQASTFKSESNDVLAPTLVKSSDGSIVYGLTVNDFVIEDNGVNQTVTMDESFPAEPSSIVVAIQIGRSAPLHFKKSAGFSAYDPFYSEAERKDCRIRKLACSTAITGLSTMLEALVEETKGEAAIVVFDSQVRLFSGFTTNIAPLAKRLRVLAAGDNGAAIVDAIGYSQKLLQSAKYKRHVLLLVSEFRDHGSRIETESGLIQELNTEDTLVCSLAFSPARSQMARLFSLQSADPDSGAPTNITSSLPTRGKNIAKMMANLSGGEYLTFSDRHTFEADFAMIDDDIRNRYLLSFHPKQPQPGLHAVQVRLRLPDSKLQVMARKGYWAR
jgi:VWFA-related protein